MTTDLQAFEVYLENLDSHGRPSKDELPISAVRMKVLNAVFYNGLRQRDPGLADKLHQTGQTPGVRPKPSPFSITPLFDAGAFHGFRIATLHSGIGHRIAEIWGMHTAEATKFPVGSATMRMTSMRPSQPATTTYADIWKEAEPNTTIRLSN